LTEPHRLDTQFTGFGVTIEVERNVGDK